MKNQINQIKQEIHRIDSTTFQTLGNHYIYYKYPDTVSISPNGSHAYKSKTTKGQPDAHFSLVDGRTIWAEYTTTADEGAVVTKFKKDIDGCVEERTELDLDPEDIKELILCYNVDLDPKKERALIKYGEERDFKITLIGLATMSADLHNTYPVLANLFLSVGIGTGQLFLANKFVEYKAKHSARIATPLDNPFVGRESEIRELREKIEKYPVVCVTGSSGVGKSRLALKVIQDLFEMDKMPAFVLAENGQNVFEDLHRWFTNIQHGYLLVEDANRQLNNLKQVITYIKQYPDKKIQVILTVRNYAKEELKQELAEINADWMTLEVVPDDVIRMIVASKPYDILDQKMQYEISRLVKGNIRFSLMVARLLHDEKIKDIPKSMLELFDQYFGTYVKDIEKLTEPNFIKTLGLLSLFKTFDLSTSNSNELNNLLKAFDLNIDDFKECVYTLRHRELVTRRFNMVVLSEQVFATYFFYRAFIKDRQLSFDKAMEYEFEQQRYTKFSEHLNEIGQRFGKEVILDAVKENLLQYEKKLDNEEGWNRYMTIFWPYREDKLLQRMHSRIRNLPAVKEKHFTAITDDKILSDLLFINSRDLRLLGKLFHSDLSYFKKALGLTFRYCSRKPDTFLALVELCRDEILLKSDSTLENAEKQRYFFQFLFDGIANGGSLDKALFLSVGRLYLAHSSSVQEYQQFLKSTGKVNDSQLREKIWQQLYEFCKTDSEAVIKTLEYLSLGRYGSFTREVISVDIDWIIRITSEHFNPELLKDTVIVNDIIPVLKKYIPKDALRQKMIDQTLKRFDTSALKILQDLGWEYWKLYHDKAKSIETQNANHNKYLKEEYLFSEMDEASEFMQNLEEIVSCGLQNRLSPNWNYIVLKENIENNVPIGEFLIRKWLALDLEISKEMGVFLGSRENLTQMYISALESVPEDCRKRRFLFFARSIAQELINDAVKSKIIETIRDLPRSSGVDFDLLKRISTNSEELLEWLTSISSQTKSGKQPHFIGEDEMFEFLTKHDLDTACTIYLQQATSDRLFDMSLKTLRKILKLRPAFVVDYVQIEFEKAKFEEHVVRKRHLGSVWSEQGVLTYFSICADKLVEKTNLQINGASVFEVLLSYTPNDFKDEMKTNVLDYLVANIKDKNKIQTILHGIRTYLPNSYKDAVYLYLDNDSSLETFRSISWTPNGGIFAANTNTSEWRQMNWKKVLNLIEDYTGDSNINEIIEWIYSNIDSHERQAINEEKRIFGYS